MKLVALALAVAVLTACGGSSTFTASGTLGLVALNAATDDCTGGTGGYDDIQEGTEVVIYSADGKKLALGELDAGKPDKDEEGLCLFDFDVPDVPSGKGPYGVEVGSRGQVSFKEGESDSIVISLG